MNRDLLYSTVCHSIFNTFGDILGATLNIVNPPIKKFFNESLTEHYGEVSNESFETIYSFCASTYLVGVLIGFITLGWLMDRMGRKETAVVVRSSIGILSGLLMVMSYLLGRFELYVIGHCLAGLVTSLKVVLVIYVSECAPDNKRGLASLMLNSGGVLITFFVTPLGFPEVWGSDDQWFMLPLLCIFIALGHLLVGITFPQSPKQLYIQEHDELAAARAVAYYHGSKVEISDVFDSYRAEMEEHELGELRFAEILDNRSLRYAFLVVLLCAFIPVFSAVNIKSGFLAILLMSFGLTQSQTTVALMAMHLLACPLLFLAPILIESFGRRPLYLIVSALCVIEWIGLAIAQSFVDSGTQSPLSWLFGIGGVVAGQGALNMGLLILSPIMIGELCPHNTRSAIGQVSQVIPIIIAIVQVIFYPCLLSLFGSTLFIALALSASVLTVVVWRTLPETKGRSVDKIFADLDDCQSARKPLRVAPPEYSYGSLDEKEVAVF